jgi:hypothetical protein
MKMCRVVVLFYIGVNEIQEHIIGLLINANVDGANVT